MKSPKMSSQSNILQFRPFRAPNGDLLEASKGLFMACGDLRTALLDLQEAEELLRKMYTLPQASPAIS